MGVIFLIVVGAMLGWLVSIVTRTEGQMHLLNLLSGIAGALVTGIVVAPLLDSGNMLTGSYSVRALLLSTLGSVLLISVVNLLRHEEAR